MKTDQEQHESDVATTGNTPKDIIPSPATSSAITLRPKPTGIVRKILWYLRVYWHRLYAAMKSPRWWFGNLVYFGVLISIAWPLYSKNHLTRGIMYTMLIILSKFGTVRRLTASQAMQMIPRDYLFRKTLLNRIILESRHGQTMSDEQVLRFQQDVLSLIANYVRSHREDSSGTEIFVNLLRIEGDEVVVVARDRNHRHPQPRYKKEGMLVAIAIEQGEVAYTGDAKKELKLVGKQYKSILVLPVRDESKVYGAVSIDSTKTHHFDLEHSELERYLTPYVSLLVWTLERKKTMTLSEVVLAETSWEKQS